ncbi:hypothetical protein E0H26_27205 [Micromonospora zingiberis]|uniref:Uncharacterized protein n=1 Tax=Micromonospora zingiberis TaxID=2053011 RepID=A0A4R0G2Q8_9ACTN|nr:hypothetical protein E0H26_27205 [Micromonospora zingiberis]
MGRGDPRQPPGRPGRPTHPRTDLAGQRRPLVTANPHTPLRPLWLCRTASSAGRRLGDGYAGVESLLAELPPGASYIAA